MSAAIDVTDPRWKDTPDMMAWKAFTDKYMSATEFVDALRRRALLRSG